MTKVIKDMDWEVSLEELRQHMADDHNYHVITSHTGYLTDHDQDHIETECNHTHPEYEGHDLPI